MLHSPFGQVIWERRFQQARPSATCSSDLEDEALLFISPLQKAFGVEHLYRDMASAIRATLERFMASEKNASARLQRQLAVLQLWQTICVWRRSPPAAQSGRAFANRE